MDAGAFGCLGVGVPFAIAASLALPNRQVISVMATAPSASMQWKSIPRFVMARKCVFVISNNAAWNIERLDQQLNYGGRVVGTTLRHSDYAAMARALGLHGERVEKPENLRPALQRALQNAPARVDMLRHRPLCCRMPRRASALFRTIRRSLRGTKPSGNDGRPSRQNLPTCVVTSVAGTNSWNLPICCYFLSAFGGEADISQRSPLHCILESLRTLSVFDALLPFMAPAPLRRGVGRTSGKRVYARLRRAMAQSAGSSGWRVVAAPDQPYELRAAASGQAGRPSTLARS